jgi:hypothetical protein
VSTYDTDNNNNAGNTNTSGEYCDDAHNYNDDYSNKYDNYSSNDDDYSSNDDDYSMTIVITIMMIVAVEKAIKK